MTSILKLPLKLTNQRQQSLLFLSSQCSWNNSTLLMSAPAIFKHKIGEKNCQILTTSSLVYLSLTVFAQPLLTALLFPFHPLTPPLAPPTRLRVAPVPLALVVVMMTMTQHF